jgi:cytochrome d ubiquinol oxidase subunit II
MVSSTTPANNLTVAATASGDYALKVMTVVAAIMFPVVLMYQGWSYWVFRARLHIATGNIDGASNGRRH